jgi:hypothetical protein
MVLAAAQVPWLQVMRDETVLPPADWDSVRVLE